MNIKFGHFNDAFKSKDKVETWTRCEKLFEENKYFDSYREFLNYLKDDAVENVGFSESDDRIDFHFFQGSKIIKGTIGKEKIDAVAEVAEYEKLSVSFMRRLMEMNFTLYHTRFALKENVICIKFDSSVLDGSPRKLYHALKELATRADKQDDLLVDDFSTLKPTGTGHVEQLSEQEKELKYKYYASWIQSALEKVASLKEDKFSGGISYLLLDTLYKIDYLISPKGTLMNDIEKISWAYFKRDNKPFTEKNRDIAEELKKLLERPKKAVIEDLYRTRSTFGIVNPAPHQAIVDTINNNIGNVKWYIENDHADIASAIYEYMAGYCLFSFGLAKPSVALFHLILNIMNQEYFNELGLKDSYYSKPGKFNEKAIKNKISGIISEGKEQFPELDFNTKNLKFDSMVSFLKQFFEEMQKLNFNN